MQAKQHFPNLIKVQPKQHFPNLIKVQRKQNFPNLLQNKTTNLVKQIAMNHSSVMPQAIAGSERNTFNVIFIAIDQSDLPRCVFLSYFSL